VVPQMSQETLAEIVGTARSRLSFFMNRFRKLGFIDYSGGLEGGLQVHSSLLNISCARLSTWLCSSRVPGRANPRARRIV
jgi:hypothetical protein